MLLDQVEAISEIATSIEKDPSISPEAIREKLQKQVAQIAGGSTTLDADRLYQEAVLLATKADNREELDRLGAHVIAARSLISEGSPVGRKLEFLAQEFNREANTLCSKANSISVTEQGLAIKVIVDQFREQVLNVE